MPFLEPFFGTGGCAFLASLSPTISDNEHHCDPHPEYPDQEQRNPRISPILCEHQGEQRKPNAAGRKTRTHDKNTNGRADARQRGARLLTPGYRDPKQRSDPGRNTARHCCDRNKTVRSGHQQFGEQAEYNDQQCDGIDRLFDDQCVVP